MTFCCVLYRLLHYLHKMISSTTKMNAKLPTIAARIGMSYSLVDCLNNGWIVSQFGCIVICETNARHGKDEEKNY